MLFYPGIHASSKMKKNVSQKKNQHFCIPLHLYKQMNNQKVGVVVHTKELCFS